MGRLTYFTMYGIITPFILIKYFKSRKEFVLIVGFASLTQAILTLCSYFIPIFKDFFNDLILYNSNFGEENLMRARGFVSVAGATFSVIQFCGVASFLIYLRYYSKSNITTLLIWCALIVIIISILFIGRTGLFLSLVALLLYIISNKISIKKAIIWAIVFFSFFQLNFLTLLEKFTTNIDGYNTELFVAWIDSGFRINNDLVEGLSEMPIPKLSYSTIIGTGLVKGPNGEGNASGHDTGYIQSYYSMGLIFAIIFYLSYYLLLISLVKKSRDFVGFILVLVLVLIESKEFFIFSYTYPFFLLSFILIGQNFNKITNINKFNNNSPIIN